jgi:hypothetical protein
MARTMMGKWLHVIGLDYDQSETTGYPNNIVSDRPMGPGLIMGFLNFESRPRSVIGTYSLGQSLAVCPKWAFYLLFRKWGSNSPRYQFHVYKKADTVYAVKWLSQGHIQDRVYHLYDWPHVALILLQHQTTGFWLQSFCIFRNQTNGLVIHSWGCCVNINSCLRRVWVIYLSYVVAQSIEIKATPLTYHSGCRINPFPVLLQIKSDLQIRAFVPFEIIDTQLSHQHDLCS